MAAGAALLILFALGGDRTVSPVAIAGLVLIVATLGIVLRPLGFQAADLWRLTIDDKRPGECGSPGEAQTVLYPPR